MAITSEKERAAGFQRGWLAAIDLIQDAVSDMPDVSHESIELLLELQRYHSKVINERMVERWANEDGEGER